MMNELSYEILILIVEDDPSVLELLETCFNGKISAAVSIKEAREKLKEGRPDLVILDRQLPDGDGIRLCEDIRSDPERRSLPVLVLTAKAEINDKVLGLNLGADDYLTKPFELDELKARVDALFRRTEKLRPGRPIKKPLWKY